MFYVACSVVCVPCFQFLLKVYLGKQWITRHGCCWILAIMMAMKKNLVTIIAILLLIIISYLIFRLSQTGVNELPDDRELTAEETEALVKSIEEKITPPEDVTDNSAELPAELQSVISGLGTISNVQRIAARDGSFVQYDVTVDSDYESTDQLLADFESSLDSSEFDYQIVLDDADFKIILANNGVDEITAEVRTVEDQNSTQLTLAYVAN